MQANIALGKQLRVQCPNQQSSWRERVTGHCLSFGNPQAHLQWHASANKATHTPTRSYVLILSDNTTPYKSVSTIFIQTTTNYKTYLKILLLLDLVSKGREQKCSREVSWIELLSSSYCHHWINMNISFHIWVPCIYFISIHSWAPSLSFLSFYSLYKIQYVFFYNYFCYIYMKATLIY